MRLSSDMADWGPRPFRFLNCWLERHGHVRIMEAEWCQITDSAPSPLSFVEKLRSLKVFLKVWNRESFGSVDLQIETTAEFLNDLEDGGMGDRSLEEFEASRHQLQGNL
ncbi:hypothetical protein V6N13_138278 [Hibiscus sabdariffa]